MSSSLALGLGALLLALPWLLMPRRNSELDGFVGVLWWLNAAYCGFWHQLEVEGSDPLPPEGPAILISNHTCCIDHMLLQSATRRLLGFIIAREIYEIWWFRPFCDLSGCIPVKRDGKDLAAMRAALKALGQGRVMPVFIEGKITPRSGRELGPGKQGAAFLALRMDVPVIPAYVYGTPETNQIFPSMRTPSRARVRFGKPVDLSDIRNRDEGDRDRLFDATARMMESLQSLRDQVWGVDKTRVAGEEMRGRSFSDGARPQERALEVSSAGTAVG